MVKGLQFENSNSSGGVTIRIAHNETDNSPVVRTVFLTAEEWTAIIAEVGVQLAPEAFADAVEVLPSADDATLTSVSEESAEGEQVADETETSDDTPRKGKRRR